MDGVVFEIKNEAGVGVVIRDHGGNSIAGLSKKFRFPLGAVEIEAEALVFGLVFIGEIRIQDLVLESDSLLSIRALCDSSPALAFVAHMIYGGQLLLMSFVALDYLMSVGRAMFLLIF